MLEGLPCGLHSDSQQRLTAQAVVSHFACTVWTEPFSTHPFVASCSFANCAQQNGLVQTEIKSAAASMD